MIDVLLAVFLGLITLVTAYLGLHVTLHPTEIPRERLLYKIGFGLCSFVACTLSGVQACRNQTSQATVNSEIKRIDENTPPIAAYLTFNAVLPEGNIQFFAEGKPLSMNVYFDNDSPLKLTDIHHYGDLSVGPQSEENEIRKQYHAAIGRHLDQDEERLKAPFSMDPGRKGAYNTITSAPLTAAQIAGLHDGSLRLYLNAYLNWRDRGQIRNADVCYWIGFDRNDPGIIRGRDRLQVCNRITE